MREKEDMMIPEIPKIDLSFVFKAAAKEPRVHWHWQNLNEDREGNVKGSGLRHGRAWLHLGRSRLGVEWRCPSARFHLGVQVSEDSEDALRVSLCVPPASISLSLEAWPLSQWIGRNANRYGLRSEDDWGGLHRDLSVRVFDWSLWWNLWRNPHHGRTRDPRQSSWHPFGFPGERLGDAREIERREVVVPMPEKLYRAIATRSVCVTRGTPRWPFSRPWHSTVTLDFGPFAPVPIPGKGENSWDCDENAIYSSSGGAETIEEEIGSFVASTLRTRRRHGGTGWRPAGGMKVNSTVVIAASHAVPDDPSLRTREGDPMPAGRSIEFGPPMETDPTLLDIEAGRPLKAG